VSGVEVTGTVGVEWVTGLSVVERFLAACVELAAGVLAACVELTVGVLSACVELAAGVLAA
jgi:hypothetical protein